MTELNRHAILVVGDVMLDRRIEGEVHRVSPEAPVPIVRQTDFREMPGGAANVAANIAAMGRKTYLLGVIGNDYAGQALGYMLPTTYSVNCCLVKRDSGKTITKTKITARGQQILRVDDENERIGLGAFDDIVEHLRNVINERSDVGLVVISDYGKGTLHSSIIKHIEHMTGVVGLPVYVDTKPDFVAEYGLIRHLDLIKPNLAEAMEMCSCDVHLGLSLSAPEEDRVAVLCQEIHRRGRFQNVLITRGGNGATFFDGQHSFTSSVSNQEVFDVTGAGDTFMAVLADARLSGYDWPSAALRANTAASEAVRHHGTTIVSRAQLEEAVENRLGLHGKIMTTESAVKFVRRHRADGHRIVLANGCFRFIHHGHWDLLRWAKHQGNVLIVAANTDDSIRSLRGEVPFIPQTYRGEMIASMPFVDAVVFFDEASVLQTIKDIHPDILVKGSEYRSATTVGADWLASKGAEVRFAPMYEGIHASDIEGETS